MEFKDRLKTLRKESNLTQAKLGELLNYGCTAIANYESGRNQPSIPDLKKIAAIFNVSMDYLLCVNDIRRPFTVDEETAAFHEFQQYYSVLSEKSREELMKFMRYLVFMEKDQDHSGKEDLSYGEQEMKPITLKAAQKPTEYK